MNTSVLTPSSPEVTEVIPVSETGTEALTNNPILDDSSTSSTQWRAELPPLCCSNRSRQPPDRLMLWTPPTRGWMMWKISFSRKHPRVHITPFINAHPKLHSVLLYCCSMFVRLVVLFATWVLSRIKPISINVLLYYQIKSVHYNSCTK